MRLHGDGESNWARESLRPAFWTAPAKRSGDGALPTVDVNLERTEHAKEFAMQAKRSGAALPTALQNAAYIRRRPPTD